MAKRGDQWFPLSQAVVAYDHARHATPGNVITLNFINTGLDAGARAGIETHPGDGQGTTRRGCNQPADALRHDDENNSSMTREDDRQRQLDLYVAAIVRGMALADPEERAEVAPSVAKSLANRWAAMSEATREIEIDNALAVREYSAWLAERQAIQAPPLLEEDAVIIAAANGDPRDGLRKALAELAVATEARGAAAETAEPIVRAAVAPRPYSAPCRYGCTARASFAITTWSVSELRDLVQRNFRSFSG
jgi:hypothetical protein